MSNTLQENLEQLFESLAGQESQIVSQFYEDKRRGVYSEHCTLEQARHPNGEPLLVGIMTAQAQVLSALAQLKIHEDKMEDTEPEKPVEMSTDDICFGSVPYHKHCLVGWQNHGTHRVGEVLERPDTHYRYVKGRVEVTRHNLASVASRYDMDKVWLSGFVTMAESQNFNLFFFPDRKELRLL